LRGAYPTDESGNLREGRTGRKNFFFEKKKQKTFAPFRHGTFLHTV
jgi:hypothetical protein